jgi:hypothetical protein
MKHHIFKVIAVLAVLFIPACGVWHNFTTYFNLYYNTSDSFQMAEEAIYLQERSIFETQDLKCALQCKPALNKVIEKALKFCSFTKYFLCR